MPDPGVQPMIPRADQPAEGTGAEAARLLLLGRLTRGVIHDFNNLLTVVLGSASALRALPLPSGPAYDLAADVERAAELGRDLMSRLLDFSSPRGAMPQAVDVNRVVADVAALVRPMIGTRIALVVRTAKGLPSVLACPGEITQVVLNLCVNACDTMPDGGTLELHTDEVSPAPGEEAGRPGADRIVRLRVADNGRGMPPDLQKRIFDVGFSTKDGGGHRGFGLSIVRDTVEARGGWLQLNSMPGRGTCFDVYLPGAAAAPLTPSAMPAPAPALADRCTVLVVDNDAAIRRLSTIILEKHGCRVVVAADGTEALATIGTAGASIDLVVLDLNMPGLSGAETLSRLWACDPQARVLLVSGDGPVDATAEVRRRIRGCLSKPFTANQLVQAVRAALSASASAEGTGLEMDAQSGRSN